MTYSKLPSTTGNYTGKIYTPTINQSALTVLYSLQMFNVYSKLLAQSQVEDKVKN